MMQVIVYTRGPLLFAFNFHVSKSYDIYKVGVQIAGEYEVSIIPFFWAPQGMDTHFLFSTQKVMGSYSCLLRLHWDPAFVEHRSAQIWWPWSTWKNYNSEDFWEFVRATFL